jgi:hypothetical protein
MYHFGRGVARDYKDAVHWYQLAAAQGHASAQSNLGLMYYEGKGILQDYASAYMWFNIAAAAGNDVMAKNRDIAERKMTAEQIEQAQRMARECMNSNFTKCD